MELEHPGMREGELSTMKVKSVWSPAPVPGLGLTGTARRAWCLVTSLGMLHMRGVLDAGKVEAGGGGSLSVTDR